MEEIRQNIDEVNLMEVIREYMYGTAEYRYNQVMAEFRDIFSHPLCDNECVWRPPMSSIGTGFLPPPLMYRSTHKACSRCDLHPVSEYDHDVCHGCAKEIENPVEFTYHHSRCYYLYHA